MRGLSSFIALTTLLLTVSTVSALPQSPPSHGGTRGNSTRLIPVERVSTDAKASPGRYIVRFKEGKAANRRKWAGRLGRKTRGNWETLNGFVADLDESALDELRASEDVEAIAEDSIVTADAYIRQEAAPWGIGRIDQTGTHEAQDPNALRYVFNYDDRAGQGVDVYVLDTGVMTTHQQFGGRASFGASFVGTTHQSDLGGHGTHCAGTIAGSRYGVAKKANIISVQILGDNGSGSISGVISGLEWVLARSRTRGRPSVASMSIGGAANSALDAAVERLTSNGIHVVVSAGNSNTDANTQSPARAPSAITVGATTIADARASYSNYGSVVDIFAPGSGIISCGITSNTAQASKTGTSMAAPHVAGAVAYYISKDGNLSPAAMSTKLKNLAQKNKISGIPSGTANNYLFTN